MRSTPRPTPAALPVPREPSAPRAPRAPLRGRPLLATALALGLFGCGSEPGPGSGDPGPAPDDPSTAGAPAEAGATPVVPVAPVDPRVADLIGRDVSHLIPGPWIVEPQPGRDPRATLVRFWTDTCPFCRATLPWLERLRVQQGPRGLSVRAVHHPKPPRLPLPPGSEALAAEDARVIEAARARGFHGALARDPDWTHMALLHPTAGRSAPTSFSLLLDRDGVVRWAHPGPELFPEPEDARGEAGESWEHLLAALDVLLGPEDAEGGTADEAGSER